MDYKTTLISAVLVLICIAPFIIFGINRKKKKCVLRDKLAAMASQKSCTISSYDTWDHHAMGMDKHNGMLFFYRNGKEEEINLAIDLKGIKKGKLNETSRNIGNKNNNTKVIEKLEMELLPLSEQQQTMRLSFYENDSNTTLGDELQLLQKWVDLVNIYLAPASLAKMKR